MYNEKIFKRCFCYRMRYWYKNIKNIPLYFTLMRYLIKNGYDEYAVWETFDWFIHTMKAILTEYKKHRHSVPVLLEDYPYDSCNDSEETQEKRKLNDEMWEETVDKMLSLLDDMDEDNPKYARMDMIKHNEALEKAKNEFFELFSKYFYCLWD